MHLELPRISAPTWLIGIGSSVAGTEFGGAAIERTSIDLQGKLLDGEPRGLTTLLANLHRWQRRNRWWIQAGASGHHNGLCVSMPR